MKQQQFQTGNYALSYPFHELENKYSQKNFNNFGFWELLSLQLCLLHEDFVRIPGAKIFV